MASPGHRMSLPERAVSASISSPRLTIFLWLAAMVFSVFGLMQLSVETSTSSVLDRQSSEWAFYQKTQEDFGGDEIIVVAIRGETPLDETTLESVQRISDGMRGVPGVRRIDSLSTVPIIHVDAQGTVRIDPPLAELRNAVGMDRDRLISELLRNSTARRVLISDDGRTAAVNIVLEREPERYYDEIFAKLRQVGAWRSGRVSGVPVFRVAADEKTRRELLRLVPLAVLLIAALLTSAFRSWRAALLGLAPGAVASAMTCGAMGAVGTSLTITTVILPAVFIALGCAYSMHLLLAYSLPGEGTPWERIGSTARPVALSGLTTAIGFVGVSLVRIDVIRDIGGFGTFGVLVVVGATLTLVPSLLALVRPEFRPVRIDSGAWAGRLVRAVSLRRSWILAGWATMAVVSTLALARLEVETDVIQWFRSSDPVRLDYVQIREELSGISPVNLVVTSETDQGVTTPEIVSALDRLAIDLEKNPRVGRVLTIASPIKELHRSFGGDDAGDLTASLIDQYLLVLESEDFFRDFLTPERNATNVIIRADDNGSGALRDIARTAEAWWDRNGVAGTSARATGIMYEFARAEDEIALGQIRGLLFAGIAIGAVLFLALKSPSTALASVVPNAVPILFTFGFMGIVGIPLDAGTVLVGNIALGIAVDDTIHLASRYSEMRRAGSGNAQALEQAIARVLPAILLTTVAVGIGFGALALSEFRFIQNLGLLTALVMVICLVADLVLLPALLLGSWKVRKNP